MSAKKHDSGKPPISLIPGPALNECAKAFGFGRGKYGQFNFKGGFDYTRLLDAAFRHLIAFKEGEDLDPESGHNHLGHALASISMLMDQVHNKTGNDDRYKPIK